MQRAPKMPSVREAMGFNDALDRVLADLTSDLGEENFAPRSCRPFGGHVQSVKVGFEVEVGDNKLFGVRHTLQDAQGKPLTPNEWTVIERTADARVYRDRAKPWSSEHVSFRVVAVTAGRITVRLWQGE